MKLFSTTGVLLLMLLAGASFSTYVSASEIPKAPVRFSTSLLMDYESDNELIDFEGNFALPYGDWQVDENLNQYRLTKKIGKFRCSSALTIEADVFNTPYRVSGKKLVYSGGKLRFSYSGKTTNIEPGYPPETAPVIQTSWWSERPSSRGYVGMAGVTLPDADMLDGYRYALLSVVTAQDRRAKCAAWSKKTTDIAARLAMTTFVYADTVTGNENPDETA